MPLRAFIDSEGIEWIQPPLQVGMVLMPLRAFIDSERQVGDYYYVVDLCLNALTGIY